MKTAKNIMVCVTQQKTCERLIKRGAEIREEQGGELFVIHVAKEGVNFLGKSREGDALEYLFEKSKNYGANLTVVRSQDVLATLRELTDKNDIGIIVLGESYENSRDRNMVSNLEKRLPEEVAIQIVPPNKKKYVI
ncbi:universal stress protein UspA [Clostridiaceae bacterium 35-E11]